MTMHGLHGIFWALNVLVVHKPADVIAHERDGLLVAPDDAVTLRRALERLLADPALQASLGSAARQRVCNEFTLEREADQVMDLYEQVLS